MKTAGFIAILSVFLFCSCRKESFITSGDAQVSLTVDTLKFDTVFVTAGSTYRLFKIINENNQKLMVSSVKLMGGVSSSYKMNVDGIAGTQFSNLEIAANDSLYVFVQVNVDPGAATLQIIIRDSIQVSYNGKDRLVQLEAWGQNAHFFRDKVVSVNETWNNDLPYVILGSLLINPGNTLTINKGCRIYVHADAPIIVDGTLLVNGLKDTIDRVYFSGDRLDAPYRDFPASWPGIFFRTTSRNNVFNYAVLKNAYQAIGISDPSPNPPVPKLVLNECIIDNAFDGGIIAINSSVRARNCLISNCGKNVFLVKGGEYEFTNCTVVTIANRFIEHREPVLVVADNITVNNAPVTAPLTALFRNCIFWGENGFVDNEVFVDKKGSVFNVNFDHNLWKVQTTPLNIVSSGIINNQPPLFDSIASFDNYYDFRLKPVLSPAIDKGVATSIPPADLDGKPRLLGSAPDLGCFERQ